VALVGPARAILQLQQRVGNRAIQRFLEGANVQGKLTVNRPGDPFEREADAAAARAVAGLPIERVSGLPADGLPHSLRLQSALAGKPSRRPPEEEEAKVQAKHASGTVQAACDECEAEAQRKDASGAARAITSAAPGSPLPKGLQTNMEQSFGADFGGVRVHTGTYAQEASKALQARAFTHGTHIYLGRGESPSDGTLMGHELTHVLQQGSQGKGLQRVAGGEQAHQPQVIGNVPAGATMSAGIQPRTQGNILSNTVTCLKKWQPCSAPRSPGTWGARVTYHCPVFPGTPGTTAPAFVTIPDEYVGTDAGGDRYQCRPKSKVAFWLDIGDVAATALTRGMLFPTQAACHAGFRANLTAVLNGLFSPSGGGRSAGVRVSQAPPGSGGVPFPCP
jgi:hypothetical protein